MNAWLGVIIRAQGRVSEEKLTYLFGNAQSENDKKNGNLIIYVALFIDRQVPITYKLL